MKNKFAISFTWVLSLCLAYFFGTHFSESKNKEIQTEGREKLSTQTFSEKEFQSPNNTIEKNSEIAKVKEKKEKYKDEEFQFYTNKKKRIELQRECESQSLKEEDGYTASCYLLKRYFLMTNQKNKYLSMLRRGCNNSNYDNCRRLLNLTKNRKEKRRLKDVLNEACFQDSGSACTSLGIFQRDALSVKATGKESINLLRKGCELDPKNCSTLGHSLASLKDPSADKYFLMSCDSGAKYACQDSAAHFLEKGNVEMASKMYLQSCGDEDTFSCRQYYLSLLARGRTEEAKLFKIEKCKEKLMWQCE